MANKFPTRNLRDLLLVLFFGPVGLVTASLTFHAGRQAKVSRSQATVNVIIVLAGAWVTWVLITVLFGHKVVRSF
ncbi:MAG TPA: hypothetical protein VFK66_15070 [Oryzihumus sp.]|nr:hypothetical protein [Oryzihumus sp.]